MRHGGGSFRVRRMGARAAAKETDRGAPSLIAAACLAQASASSLPAIPWWPGIQVRVVFPARLFSMRPRSIVSAEPLWIALRSDWLSVQMAVAACDAGATRAPCAWPLSLHRMKK